MPRCTTTTTPAMPTTTTTPAASVPSDADAVATTKRILASRTSALALKGAERTRNLDNVRLVAAAACLAHASNTGARIAVEVETRQRGGGAERNTLTAPVVAVLRSVALGVPVVGSSTLAK